MFALAVIFGFVWKLARERLHISPIAPNAFEDFFLRFRLLFHADCLSFLIIFLVASFSGELAKLPYGCVSAEHFRGSGHRSVQIQPCGLSDDQCIRSPFVLRICANGARMGTNLRAHSV